MPDPEEAIDRFLTAKLRGKTPRPGHAPRLSAALQRRGFSWQDIRPALARWTGTGSRRIDRHIYNFTQRKHNHERIIHIPGLRQEPGEHRADDGPVSPGGHHRPGGLPRQRRGGHQHLRLHRQRQESEAIDTILSAAQLKAEGQVGKILVTGCLSQRYQADILDELPEIDGIMGTGCFGDIVTALEQVVNGQECRHFADINGPVEELPRVLSTPRQYAYLRIAEGCSNRCAYCVIPSLRGNYRSRRMEDILRRPRPWRTTACRSASSSLRTSPATAWICTERRLPELLRELCRLPFHWVRLHYLYPDNLSDELIDTIAGEEEKICNYLDIPIQHCNDNILRAMRRRETKAGLEELFAGPAAPIPGLVLRTSIITGLPYEDEAAFEELCSFFRRRRSSGWGPSPTLPEEGTPAAKMLNRVDSEQAQSRAELVMEMQTQVMDEFNESRLGTTLEVLCDGFDGQSMAYVGRSYAESPGIDGSIYFTSGSARGSGRFCPCAHHRGDGRRSYR